MDILLSGSKMIVSLLDKRELMERPLQVNANFSKKISRSNELYKMPFLLHRFNQKFGTCSLNVKMNFDANSSQIGNSC